MKQQAKLIFLLSVFVFGLFITTNSINAESLTNRLKGKILLQVEQNGEAWYINPANEKRYFMGRPNDAFSLMREFGLGIKHNELTSYLNSTFPLRLSGKIMLDVEASGEAYYVYPDDLSGYYLGRPADAFNIMRNLSLGITDINLEKIQRGLDTYDWKTYIDAQYGFEIQYPEKINNKNISVPELSELEYYSRHYIMFIGQMSITIYPADFYEFLDVKQSECYEATDEESCSVRNKISCGSGECSEIPNFNVNLGNYDSKLFSKEIDRCYAAYSGETICPTTNYKDNILVAKKGNNYFKIKQPIFSSTGISEEEKWVYERMLQSFRFID